MRVRATLLALGALLAFTATAEAQARPPAQKTGPITIFGDGSTGPISDMSVKALGTPRARPMKERAADIPSIGDFGTAVNGDWTAAFQAAEASGFSHIMLPAGRYPTTLGHLATRKTYVGPGQQTSGSDISGNGGVKEAPFRSFITDPLPIVPDPIDQSYNADFSKMVPGGAAYTYVSANATGPAKNIYTNLTQLGMSFKTFENYAGFNTVANDHAQGRSGIFVDNTRAYHNGQGDLVGKQFFGLVNSKRAGATHWLANPAIIANNGNIGADTNGEGAYLQESEYVFTDAGVSVSAIGTVKNYIRTNNTKTVDQVWGHDRPQSGGSKPIDFFYGPAGLGRTVFDATGVFSADGAAFVMKGGQRIFYNATPNVDSIGINFGAGDLGQVWTIYDGSSKTLRMNVGTGGALVIDNMPVSGAGVPAGLTSGSIYRLLTDNTLRVVP
jgi:hypothetical protein